MGYTWATNLDERDVDRHSICPMSRTWFRYMDEGWGEMLGCPHSSILRVLSRLYELPFIALIYYTWLRLIIYLHSVQLGHRPLSSYFFNIRILEFEFEVEGQGGLGHSPRIGHFVSH